jgi:hypothetical protein
MRWRSASTRATERRGQKRQVTAGSGVEHRLQVRVYGDGQGGTCLALPDAQHAVADVLRSHADTVACLRAAGEDSFRTRELINVCAAAGWDTVYTRRINLFPNFTPGAVYRMLTWLEPIVEKSSFLNGLCTVNMLGLKRR